MANISTFVGSTGGGGGGPTSTPIYATLSSSSASVSKGEPVAISNASAGEVTKILSDPTLVCTATGTLGTVETTFQNNMCIAYISASWCCESHCCLDCCRIIGTSSNPYGIGFDNTIRVTEDKYVRITLNGGIGYTDVECFGTGLNCCQWMKACCIYACGGTPAAANFQVPCFCISEFQVDGVNQTVCKTAATHIVPGTTYASADQKCVDYTNVKLECGIPGLPSGGTVHYFDEIRKCLCDACYSGTFEKTSTRFGHGTVAQFTGNNYQYCTTCCCEGSCDLACHFLTCDNLGMPFLMGSAANGVMNLISCTGTKFYSMFPVAGAASGCDPLCQYSACSILERSCTVPGVTYGLMSFSLCSNGTQVDMTSPCIQYDLSGNWNYGYVTRNKKYMFGEKTKIAVVTCGWMCSCNRGCGYIYVNEINDSFVPNPQCGCIACTNRLMQYGEASDPTITCSETQWRFWPTSENDDGWVIATQPIEVTCVKCYGNAYKEIERLCAYMKIMAIKPIGQGQACMTNVVCLCHKFSTDGGICWGFYNGELGCCTCSTFVGLDYLSCDKVDGTPGNFVVFDHSDAIFTSQWWCLGDTDKPVNYAKPTCVCSCSGVAGGTPQAGGDCGALPQAHLHRVCTCSGIIQMRFKNFWFPYPGGGCFEYPDARGYISPYCSCAACCRTNEFHGCSCVCLSIDDATNCLTISACANLTKYNEATYHRSSREYTNRDRLACQVEIFDKFVGCVNGAFEEVNVMRGRFPFDIGNTLIWSTNVLYTNNCCTYCFRWDRHGGYQQINGCCGGLVCGCGCAAPATMCINSDRPVLGSQFNNLGADPLAWTWVTTPYIDQDRFTSSQRYVYQPWNTTDIFCFNCCNVSLRTSFCANNSGQFQWDCDYEWSAITPPPGGQMRRYANCCWCIDAVTHWRYNPFGQATNCTLCIGLRRYEGCSACSNSAIPTCSINESSLYTGNICLDYAQESNNQIFAQKRDTHSYPYGTCCNTRYAFVTEPNQANLSCFAGWALADATAGSTVPVMGVDRGFLPLDGTIQGWCNMSLSYPHRGGCCNFLSTKRTSGSVCVTNFIYGSYSGNCCLTSSSPFYYYNWICGGFPRICIIADENGCCCAFVTSNSFYK